MRGVPVGSLVAVLLRRPRLWGEVIAAGVALARRGWWRRWPFLPIPDDAYIDWRVATAYGSADEPATVEDVVHYLEWRRRQRA